MRPQLTVIGAAAIIVCLLIITGCSKSSKTPTQANKQKQALDALIKQFRTNDDKIAEAQTNLDALRNKYNVQDTSPTQLVETNLALASSEEPYWIAKSNLVNMIDLQRTLQAKINRAKIDAAIPRAPSQQ